MVICGIVWTGVIVVKDALLKSAKGHWRTRVAEQFKELSVATEEMADEPPELTGSVLWNCRTYLFAAREVFARFVAICRLASVLHAASPTFSSSGLCQLRRIYIRVLASNLGPQRLQ